MKFDFEKINILHVFDVDPCTAPRQVYSDRWKKRTSVMKYRAAKDELRLTSKNYMIPPVVNVLFVIPFPKSYSKKKRNELLHSGHQIKPDRDNLLKWFQDTLCDEDRYIWGGETYKIWGEKGQVIIYERK